MRDIIYVGSQNPFPMTEKSNTRGHSLKLLVPFKKLLDRHMDMHGTDLDHMQAEETSFVFITDNLGRRAHSCAVLFNVPFECSFLLFINSHATSQLY